MPRSFLRRDRDRDPQSPRGPAGLLRQLVNRGSGVGASQSNRRDYEHNIPIPSEPRPYIPLPQLPTPTRGSPLDQWAEVNEFGQMRQITVTASATATLVDTEGNDDEEERRRGETRQIVISEETLARMRGFRARADSLELDDWPAEEGAVQSITTSPNRQSAVMPTTDLAPSPSVRETRNAVVLVDTEPEPLRDLIQVPTVHLTTHRRPAPVQNGFSDSVPPFSTSGFGGLLSRGDQSMTRSSSGDAIREMAATVTHTTAAVARSLTKKISVDSLLGRKKSKGSAIRGIDTLPGSRRIQYEALPPTPPTPSSPFVSGPLPPVPRAPTSAPRSPLPAMRSMRQNRFGVGVEPASTTTRVARTVPMGSVELNTMPRSRQVSGATSVSPFVDPPATPTAQDSDREQMPTPKTPIVAHAVDQTPKSTITLTAPASPVPPAAASESDTFRTPIQPRPLALASALAIPSTPTLCAGHRCRVPGSTFDRPTRPRFVIDEPAGGSDETPRARPRPQPAAKTRVVSAPPTSRDQPQYTPSDSPQLPRAELLAFLFPSPPPRIPLPPTPTVAKRSPAPARDDDSPLDPQGVKPCTRQISPVNKHHGDPHPTSSITSDEAPPNLDSDGDRSFDSIQSTESVQALQVSHQRSMSEMKAAFRRMKGLADADVAETVPSSSQPPRMRAENAAESAETAITTNDFGPSAVSVAPLSPARPPISLDDLEPGLREVICETIRVVNRDRSASPVSPVNPSAAAVLASPAQLGGHTPRESISSHQFSDIRSTLTHTTLHPDDSRSNIAYNERPTTPPPVPSRRPLSRASSLGSIARGPRPTESALERVERRQGAGWWSTPRRESQVGVGSDVKSDRCIEQLEHAARSAAAVAIVSPIRLARTPGTVTPLVRTSRRLILASGGHRPMSAGEPSTRRPRNFEITSPVQHAVSQWRKEAGASTSTSSPGSTGPRISLVGDSTWAQAVDGNPIKLPPAPALRGKTSRTRVCSEAIPAPSSSPFGPSSSGKKDKGKARAVSSTIALGRPRTDSLTVTIPKPFAREVSPEIARRASQLAQRIESSSSGYTSSSRRAGADNMSTAPTSLEPSSEEEEVEQEQETPTRMPTTAKAMGKVKSAVLDINSIQQKHESEIDTLVHLLSQTREENKELRQQVISLQATVGGNKTPKGDPIVGTPKSRTVSSPVVSPLSRQNLAQLEDLYTPRSRAKTGVTTPLQKSTLREATTSRML